MTNDLQMLLQDFERQLVKAIDHFEYSYNKVLKLSNKVETLDLEQLETWESFTSRFSRVSDIFVTKYLRTLFKIQDPAYKGFLIDHLNMAEKQNLISDAAIWYKIRELRNKEAHEYTEEQLGIFFNDLRNLAPLLISIRKII